MKTTHWLSCWQLGLLGLLTSAGINAFTCKTLAQTTPSNIKPDSTLGAESSQILQNQNFRGLPIEEIRGGATRGINLFHSFLEFNISAGRGAYFLSPSADILNIFARVTGANRSEILGTLGTFGNSQPNLYLINPNGIIFGKNASLDVQGSFMGTTANGVQFGNLGNFSATNPQPVPLLTINPSALFVNQINKNGGIINQSQAPAGVNLSGEDVTGLRVPDGKSLLLVGGNVNLDGGGLTASGGRVELAGLSAPGSVGLNVAGDTLSLSFPNDVQQGNISLSNRAFVDVTGAEKGDIAINASNLQMSNSFLLAGIGTGLGDGSTKAGDININADAISLTNGAIIVYFTYGKGDAGNIFIAARDAISLDSGLIVNLLLTREAEGNAGNINITTGSLTATNGADIGSTIAGKGNAGNITIQARDAVIFDARSALFSNVQDGGVGNGGNINITAGSLSLNNSHLDSGVYSNSGTLTANQGKGGTISISVRDALTISGEDSGIFGELGTGAIGRGGDIKVEAGNVFVRDGGQIISSTFGKGDAGNISITARDAISLDGASSYIINNVQSGDAVGNAGKIDITTGSLTVTNGAQINSFTRGKGNAGNITIQARDAVIFDGQDNNGLPSASFSQVLAGGVGNGGNINLTAGSLSLTNSGQLGVGVNEASGTLASGQGIGGILNINVRDALTISGADSEILGSLGTGAIGRGGDIKVEAGNIFVRDGGKIISSTFGKGNAGNISITARDALTLDGTSSYIINNVQSGDAVGNAGNIDITTGFLTATNGAQINSFTRGKGNAGNITIQARDVVIFDGQDNNGLPSASFSDVQAGAVGNGGSINITASNLSLINGGQLGVGVFGTSNTLPPGQGNGGILNINLRDTLTVSGTNSNIRSGLGIGTLGRSGNINITSGKVEVIDSGIITSRSKGTGTAGEIDIKANSVFLNNGQINAQTASSDGGNINLNLSDYLLLRNGSQISATAGTDQAGGNGGNININSRFIVAIPNENSDISTNAFTGAGGNIQINSQGIFGIEARPKPTENSDITASSELGVSGVVNINAADTSSIQNSFAGGFPNAIDANALIGQSCIARGDKRQENTFFITGSGALNPNRPGGILSNYSTGEVRGVEPSRPWKKGDPIIEATGVYRLSNGQILLSRECSN